MKKILIFEDDIYLVRALDETLGDKGFKTETILRLPATIEAESFQDLLRRSSEFSLIVWDAEIRGDYSFKGYIQAFAEVFEGPMIAHSGSTAGRAFQMSAGCTHEVPKEGFGLVDKIVELVK